MRLLNTLILICIFLNLQAQTNIIEIDAEADNTIYDFNTDNSNALGANLLCGTSGGAYPRRGLIKFNINNNIPQGSTIVSVSLQLYCSLARNITDSIKIHKLISPWGEANSNAGAGADGAGIAATSGDATWLTKFYPNDLWMKPGGDYISNLSAFQLISAIGTYYWSSSQMAFDVQNWLNNPAENFGWIMIGNERVQSTARKFSSKQNSIVENRPKLTVTYLPPGSNTTYAPDIISKNQYFIFPNPVQNFLIIKNEITNTEKHELSIVDLTGRLIIYKKIINVNSPIDISGLNPGFFIVEINDKKNKKYNKFKILKL